VGVNERQRNLLAVGSFGLTLVGIGLQFGPYWALIVAGLVGVGVALLLAFGAVR
jgi:hypothetical protein